MREIRETLTYADVLIEPQYSDIKSRDDINNTALLFGKIRLPIISAPMDTVSGPNLVVAMSESNAYGILHRFQEKEVYRVIDVSNIATRTDKDFGVSVGVKDATKELIFLNRIANEVQFNSVLIDVAHGYHEMVGEMIKLIQQNVYGEHWKPFIIAGNVATYDGFSYLADLGVNGIRVGIGGGSACTTRENTGIGVPQLTAVMHCAEANKYYDTVLIADGGIQHPGDIVKALAAGADAVMIGRLLAGTDEAAGERWGNTVRYSGQSIVGTNGARKAPEGIAGTVSAQGPVKGVIESLSQYIKSGMSYVGARNLEELRNKANFIRVSAGTAAESGVRI